MADTPLIPFNSGMRLRKVFGPLLRYLDCKTRSVNVPGITGGAIICAMSRMMSANTPPIQVVFDHPNEKEGCTAISHIISSILIDVQYGYNNGGLLLEKKNDKILMYGMFEIDLSDNYSPPYVLGKAIKEESVFVSHTFKSDCLRPQKCGPPTHIFYIWMITMNYTL